MREEGLSSKRIPRNPLLFSILHRMKLVEQIGSGIRRIRDACEETSMREDVNLVSAALYTRVSSDRQAVDLSVAAQLRALRDFAERNDYVVAREYIDEAAAPVVREVFGKAFRDHDLKHICRDLNKRGTTDRGRRWQRASLHKLLVNETYTGTAVWDKTNKGKKVSDPVRVEGAWPAIVSRELFDCRDYEALETSDPTLEILSPRISMQCVRRRATDSYTGGPELPTRTAPCRSAQHRGEQGLRGRLP